MENFGLIEALRAKCIEKGYFCIYGQDEYINALSDEEIYNAYEKLLRCDFSANVTRVNGVIQSISYVGLIGLGQKHEATTESSLDETPDQKYDRRLKDLTTALSDFIKEMTCVYELEVTNEQYDYDLNQYDLNADFVSCSITFVS